MDDKYKVNDIIKWRTCGHLLIVIITEVRKDTFFYKHLHCGWTKKPSNGTFAVDSIIYDEAIILENGSEESVKLLYG